MAERNGQLAAPAFTSSMRAVVLTLAACFGCATTAVPTTPAHRHSVPGYVFGIWGKAELDTRDDCPTTGPSSLRVGATWTTVFLSVITLGVYTPREVTVHCRAKP
jgi:hypothetical protein